MSFDPVPKEITKEWYGERAIEKLPEDVLAACDRIRAQKKEIDELRWDLIAANKNKWLLGVKNTVLLAIICTAAAKGIEAAIVALWPAILKVIS